MPQQVATFFPLQFEAMKMAEVFWQNSISMLEWYVDYWKLFGLDFGVENWISDRKAELEFSKVFTDQQPKVGWSVDDSKVLLDLPGMRVIDISETNTKCPIDNWTLVVAPRAGHHSSIAERVALYLRDQGLSRMAVVEQKCGEEIPLFVNSERHYENFDGQVEQYRQILERLKAENGYPVHVVAVCQPGPLLAMTTILYPELVKTFGSAGSPMNTAERGFLSDTSRKLGEGYVDWLMATFGRTVPEGQLGVGRRVLDGRFHVLGFYALGYETHMKNLWKLLADLRSGNHEEADRQLEFYGWYNWALDFPAGFISDTYKKLFIKNGLVDGIKVAGQKIGITDFPANIPIWAIGGQKDDIAPWRQAMGHMGLTNVPVKDQLILLPDVGHMAIFRSKKVLEKEYKEVCKFIQERSDK